MSIHISTKNHLNNLISAYSLLLQTMILKDIIIINKFKSLLNRIIF